METRHREHVAWDNIIDTDIKRISKRVLLFIIYA